MWAMLFELGVSVYSSWLNQVECWFGILTRQALRGASFPWPLQLSRAVDAFVGVDNENAASFPWRKAVVSPCASTAKYSPFRE
jgi:hypothetical protein